MISKIRKSGVVETFFLSFIIGVNFVFSRLFIIFLRLRKYNIHSSVKLSRNVYFFQSTKNSILIKKKSRIGSGVRIKSGFEGKIIIGENVLVDDYSYISAQEMIEVGDNTQIAANSYIVDFNHEYPLSKSIKNIDLKSGYRRKPVRIGSYVWIGAHVVILAGVRIGNNSVIGAGSVVTKNIPSNSIAVGNPARVIKQIKHV